MPSRTALVAALACAAAAWAPASGADPARSAADTCAGVPPTIVGTAADDELTGTPIPGSYDDDVLLGSATPILRSCCDGNSAHAAHV